MPPWAAMECARRGESEMQKLKDVEAHLGKRRSRRSVSEAGADHNHVETTLVGRVDEFLMSLVVRSIFQRQDPPGF